MAAAAFADPVAPAGRKLGWESAWELDSNSTGNWTDLFKKKMNLDWKILNLVRKQILNELFYHRFLASRQPSKRFFKNLILHINFFFNSDGVVEQTRNRRLG